MPQQREHSKEIQDFIVNNVDDHPKDITAFTSQAFDISRPAVLRHIHQLIDRGILSAQGKTRNRSYELRPLQEMSIILPVTLDTAEYPIWQEYFSPFLDGALPNVIAICAYGVTEMVNNIVAHSEGTEMALWLEYTPTTISIIVHDNGIGIFQKIKRDFNLYDERDAILELSKGKLTTDPEHHTGEGVFFTSRVFDSFTVMSGKLYFAHGGKDNDDWLLEDEEVNVAGTYVQLRIHPESPRQIQEVFDRYAASEDFGGFSKTIVPVTLARYGNENLISRSQAKRLLARFERFKEVVLDFKGVETIGQAFADEVFRVFPSQHPNVRLMAVNENEQIKKMIARALSARAQQQ